MRTPSDRLIVALDGSSADEAIRLARQLRPVIQTVKIGSALFTRFGPQVIRQVRRLGLHVMLDLKFFDIPSTVELSVRAATTHDVSMLTVHASGGEHMLQAAVAASRSEADRLHLPAPVVIGVTVLTSVAGTSRAAVRRRVATLADTAARAGCGAVVASAQEAGLIRRRLAQRVEIFCPGIRLAGAGRADQARVLGPREALMAGADRLIVGRPITGAADPLRAAQQILNEMEIDE